MGLSCKRCNLEDKKETLTARAVTSALSTSSSETKGQHTFKPGQIHRWYDPVHSWIPRAFWVNNTSYHPWQGHCRQNLDDMRRRAEVTHNRRFLVSSRSLLFFVTTRQGYTLARNNEINKNLGKIWKAVTEQEKRSYEEQATVDKVRYLKVRFIFLVMHFVISPELQVKIAFPRSEQRIVRKAWGIITFFCSGFMCTAYYFKCSFVCNVVLHLIQQ